MGAYCYFWLELVVEFLAAAQWGELRSSKNKCLVATLFPGLRPNLARLKSGPLSVFWRQKSFWSGQFDDLWRHYIRCTALVMHSYTLSLCYSSNWRWFVPNLSAVERLRGRGYHVMCELSQKNATFEPLHYSPFLFKRQSVQSALWEESLTVN